MAGDWIKMRVGLAKDPRVIAIADRLATRRGFMDWLTDPVRRTCDESAYEYVTRNVTVSVTVAALLQIWGVANEAGKPDGDDLVLKHTVLNSLDEIAGVPCFGEAMAYVEWAVEEDCDGKPCVRLPKFLINNVPAEDRNRKAAAERQRRYREKHNASGDADGDVTRDVTVTHREEKRREEVKQEQKRPPAAAFDFRADLFARWKSVPGSGGGAFLSRLFKDHKPEQRVIEAVEHTLSETRADPKAFVVGVLKAKPAASNPIEAGIAEADRIRAGWKANPETAPWAGCTWDHDA